MGFESRTCDGMSRVPSVAATVWYVLPSTGLLGHFCRTLTEGGISVKWRFSLSRSVLWEGLTNNRGHP